MSHGDPIRIYPVSTPRRLLPTIRDVAIILVSAVLLLGTVADALLGSRLSAPPTTSPAVSSAAEAVSI